MIVVALGFAAVENFVYLVRYEGIFPQLGVFSYALVFSGLRFAGATFLHALCSGVVGFFLALGILKIKQRRRLIIAGIIIATALHGFFNLFIIEMEKSSYFAIGPITIIIALAFFISYAFKKAKEIKSVCEIK